METYGLPTPMSKTGSVHVRNPGKSYGSLIQLPVLRSVQRDGRDGVLAVRLSGLQGLHRELQWDGENMRFTNISPNDKIKIVTVDDFKVMTEIRVLTRRFAEFNAAEMANEWIKHTYNNGFSLPDMPR